MESHLPYRICAWGGASKVRSSTLEVTQNQFSQLIFKKHKIYSTEALYNETKILYNIQFFYISYCKYFQCKTKERCNKNIFLSPLMLKTCTQRLFQYLVFKLYNSQLKYIKLINNKT